MALLPDTDPVKGGWEKNQSELCTLVQAGHPRAQSAAILWISKAGPHGNSRVAPCRQVL